MFKHLKMTVHRIALWRGGEEVVWADLDQRKAVIRSCMELFISLFILVVASVALFLELDPESKKYFSGFLGLVIGYWLR